MKSGCREVKGFSIVEVLISVAIIGIIAVSGFGYNFFVDSYNLGKDTFLYVYVYGDIERKGALALEQMVHGVKGHKGIQESQDITLPIAGSSGSTITFVEGLDASNIRQFYKSDDKLKYNDPDDPPVKDIIDSGVATLTFTRPSGSDDLVVIDLVLQKTALDKDITVDLTTSVKLRNKR